MSRHAVHHINIHTPDLERLWAFYREAFGFELVFEHHLEDFPIVEAITGIKGASARVVTLKARNTFIEVDPATWLTKPTDTVQLGHVIVLEKQDVTTKRKHRFTFLVTTHGETAVDEESGIECLPHNSPLASAVLGLAVNAETKVRLPAGESLLTVRSIRNPTQTELDRLLTAIKPPEIEEEDS